MLASDEDILVRAEEWRKGGKGVAIATVIEPGARRRGLRAPIW